MHGPNLSDQTLEFKHGEQTADFRDGPATEGYQVVDVHRFGSDVLKQFSFVSVGSFRWDRLTFYRIAVAGARCFGMAVRVDFSEKA